MPWTTFVGQEFEEGLTDSVTGSPFQFELLGPTVTLETLPMPVKSWGYTEFRLNGSVSAGDALAGQPWVT